ncbi:MAG: hypothetical protein H6739_00725 [Alphaproteobacteria bacterium]|nr:hypothetical protein [Alphaproteobacteria bacterium]
MSRRRFLLESGALTALAWLGLAAYGHRPLPPLASPALGDPARRTLEAALEVLLPSDAPWDEVAAGVDAFLADADPFATAQLRLALQALEHLGGTWLPPTRFSRLDPDARRAALTRWERSPVATFRQIFQALRRLAGFSWYADPRTWAAIGYDGPTVGR